MLWQADKRSSTVKGRLRLKESTVLGPGSEHESDELFGFELRAEGRCRELLAGSRSEREMWVHGLCSVIASLNGDKAAVDDVRRRAVSYLAAWTEAGCLDKVLEAPLPGEQADVDLERLLARGLLVHGAVEYKRGWSSFKKRELSLGVDGCVRLFEPGKKQPSIVIDAVTAEVLMHAVEPTSVSLRSEKAGVVELRCASIAMRNDVVFGAFVVAEVRRRLDVSCALDEAKRRSHVGDACMKTRLRVACVTWNVNEKDADADALFTIASTFDADIVAVAAQEVAPKLAAMTAPCGQKWDAAWGRVLNSETVHVKSCGVGPTRLALFARSEVLPMISKLADDVVACGSGGMPNKGAAAIRLCLRDSSVLFVAAHLAAHQNFDRRRDEDARRIDDKLFVNEPSSKNIFQRGANSPPPRREPVWDDVDALKAARGNEVIDDDEHRHHLKNVADARLLELVDSGQIPQDKYDAVVAQLEDFWEDDDDDDAEQDAPLLDEDDDRVIRPRPSRLIDEHAAVFFMGDLNYRLDLDREEAENLVDAAFTYSNDILQPETALEILHSRDQLLARLTAGSRQFYEFPTGFAEMAITFPPTFKFDPGTNDYDTSAKRRVPAWCDRVLYAPKPNVHPETYSSVNAPSMSDHRPVVATFAIDLADTMELGDDSGDHSFAAPPKPPVLQPR